MSTISLPTYQLAIARVSGRVVVVVVRELFFLVTSAICVRIRGRRSEVTKTVVSLALRLTVSSTTNCATERDHAECVCGNQTLFLFLRMPSATGFTIQASAAGASSATMTINYDNRLS